MVSWQAAKYEGEHCQCEYVGMLMLSIPLSMCHSSAMWSLVSLILQQCFFFCHISVWCQGLEVFVAFPPAAMSAPGYGAEMAAVFISNRGVAGRPSLEAATTHSFCLSLQYFFFLAGKHQRLLFDPTCVSLRDPLPEESVAPPSTLIHHVHPVLIDFQCAFWKGLQPSAGSWGTKGTPRSPPFSTSEG